MRRDEPGINREGQPRWGTGVRSTGRNDVVVEQGPVELKGGAVPLAQSCGGMFIDWVAAGGVKSN